MVTSLIEIEKKIIFFIKKIRNIDTISSEEDFLNYTGSSIMAVRLMTEIEDYYDIDIPLSLIFDYRTPGDLAKEISKEVNQ